MGFGYALEISYRRLTGAGALGQDCLEITAGTRDRLSVFMIMEMGSVETLDRRSSRYRLGRSLHHHPSQFSAKRERKRIT